MEILRSQTVIGRYEKDGFYYPGVVAKCQGIRTASVDFDNLGRYTLPSRFIIPMTGAVARPILQVKPEGACKYRYNIALVIKHDKMYMVFMVHYLIPDATEQGPYSIIFTVNLILR